MKRAQAHTFRDLVVWQKAHAFVLAIYRISESFPPAERSGITAQLRRAAVSIAANIAEGFRKRTGPDKLRFYNIAQGSADESHYYLILVHDLGICDATGLNTQLDEVSRLLQAYVSAMTRR